MTAKWPAGEGLQVLSDSPDRLKGKYGDPKTSKTKLTVKEATRGNPNEVQTLELSST